MCVFNLINFTKLCSLLATFFNVKSTLKQRFVCQCWNLQRRINIVNFSGNNNVRQRQNNIKFSIAIFNIKFCNVDQRRNNVVNMAIFKKSKRVRKYFWASKKRWLILFTTLAFDCDWSKRKGNIKRPM